MSSSSPLSPPALLTYDVSPQSVPVSTATPSAGLITVTIHANETVLCDKITLHIPIGDWSGALFSKRPTSSQTGWTHNGDYSNANVLANEQPNYHSITLINPDKDKSVTASFSVTIKGNVCTEQGLTTIKIFEHSAPVSSSVLLSKETSLNVDKDLPLSLYIRSFVAINTATPTVPASEFANGTALSLSWESNGTNFKLYQKDGLTPIDVGSAKSCVIEKGITTDSTFVLVATLISPNGDTTMQDEALTLTVSNPTFKKVGVGNTNADPGYPLTVQSDSGRMLGFSDENGNDRYNFSLLGGGLSMNESNKEAGLVFIQDGGNVGINTTTPGQKLDVHGGNIGLDMNFDLYLRDLNHGIGYYGNSKKWNSYAPDGPIVYGYGGGALGTCQSTNGITKTPANLAVALAWTSAGQVGIGTTGPTQALDVNGGILARAHNPIRDQGAYLQWNRTEGEGETWLLNQKGSGNANAGIRFGSVTQGDAVTEWARFSDNGHLSVGTTQSQYPLHVFSKKIDLKDNINLSGIYARGVIQSVIESQVAGSQVYRSQDLNVSIYAEGWVIASEFVVNSDARLKTIIGRSDADADLSLLNRLRITDYTMRDQVQFGGQTFKKIIAQELEEIFPQAVHQHTGFLPDINVTASEVQRLGETLLRVSLSAGLTQAATAGQRLKLIGATGEVVTTLVEATAAGSQQLLVSGGNELADLSGEVFVFGLEHPDVRSIDYDSVAMLNVSATQALARQVAELHQQNTVLNEQNQAQRTQLEAMQSALRVLQGQVAALVSNATAPSSI